MATDIYNGIDREFLGRRVREKWIAWAKEQPLPKASWFTPWEQLSESDREVDRRIGEAIARESISLTLHVCFYCGDPATRFTIDGADSKLICGTCPSVDVRSGASTR